MKEFLPITWYYTSEMGNTKDGKKCLFLSSYMTILIYEAEIWAQTKTDISKLTAVEINFKDV
jgi:hypothetical protein